MNLQSTNKWWRQPQPLWLNGIILVTTIILWGLTYSVFASSGESLQPALDLSAGSKLPYQGFLTDINNQPLNGSYTIKTEVCDALTGGTCHVPETYTSVPVQNGVFSLVLGSKTSGNIPATIWDNPPAYLQISIDGETLSPRELIAAPPERQWRLIGIKTSPSDSTPSLVPSTAWQAIRGSDINDKIEVTVSTQGGPLMINMTARFRTVQPTSKWCAIHIYDDQNQLVQIIHLDGSISDTPVKDYGCSASYIHNGLPSGTYTFQAFSFTHKGIETEWLFDRQIAVSEYR